MKLVVGKNDFKTLYPELANEWDYDANDKDPSEVLPGTHYVAHWICSKHGDKWATPVRTRVIGKGYCPTCRENIRHMPNKPAEGRSLEDVRPDVASQWDYDMNWPVTPKDIGFSSGKQFYWKCELGHTWRTSANSRTSHGNGDCPYCIGRKVWPGFNDLASVAPLIADEFAEDLNEGKTAEQFTAHSNTKVWWRCSHCKEAWTATIYNRVDGGTGCPYCVDYRRRTSFPTQALFYYVSKMFPDAIANCRPEEIASTRYMLDIWIPSIKTVIEYDGQEWHKDVDRDVRRDDACLLSGMKVIRIREPKCPEYKKDGVSVIVRSDAYSYGSLNEAIESCLGLLGKTCDVNVKDDSLKILETLEDSIVKQSVAEARPDIAEDWGDKNGVLKPNMFHVETTRRVWWKCPEGHDEYFMSVQYRTRCGGECPACSREYKGYKISIARRRSSSK